MEVFLGAFIGNIVISFGIVLTILIVRGFKNKLINYINSITAVTVGLMLGIIFLGFIPELIDSGVDGEKKGLFILFGILIFYILELFLHWHHCQDLSHTKHSCHHTNNHDSKNGLLMFGATMLHNSFHGIILFGAFAIDITFGIVTTFAILLHSIPQNIVNYIMNHKADKWSFIAAFGGMLGVLLTYPFYEILLINKELILAFIVGGLLYTALADIFPEFKSKGELKSKIKYLFFIVIGVCMFLGFNLLIK